MSRRRRGQQTHTNSKGYAGTLIRQLSRRAMVREMRRARPWRTEQIGAQLLARNARDALDLDHTAGRDAPPLADSLQADAESISQALLSAADSGSFVNDGIIGAHGLFEPYV